MNNEIYWKVIIRFELNWSEQVKGLEESLRYSKFKIACRKLFNKVDDFLHSLYSQDEKESYNKIKGNLSKLLAELKEEYSCGVQLRVAVPNHDKEINHDTSTNCNTLFGFK